MTIRIFAVVAAICAGVAHAAMPDVAPLIRANELSKQDYNYAKGVVFAEKESVQMEGAILLEPLKNWRHDVPANTQLLPRTCGNRGSKYFVHENKTLKNAFGGDAGRSCFIDADNDGSFESVASLLWARSGEFTISPKEMPPLRYELAAVEEKTPVMIYTVRVVRVDDATLELEAQLVRAADGCLYGSKQIIAPVSLAESSGVALPVAPLLLLDEKPYKKAYKRLSGKDGPRLYLETGNRPTAVTPEDSELIGLTFAVKAKPGFWRVWPEGEFYKYKGFGAGIAQYGKDFWELKHRDEYNKCTAPEQANTDT